MNNLVGYQPYGVQESFAENIGFNVNLESTSEYGTGAGRVWSLDRVTGTPHQRFGWCHLREPENGGPLLQHRTREYRTFRCEPTDCTEHGGNPLAQYRSANGLVRDIPDQLVLLRSSPEAPLDHHLDGTH